MNVIAAEIDGNASGDYNSTHYLINAASGNITFLLPEIIGDGIVFTVIRIDSSGNTVSIQPSGLDSMAGGNASLAAQNSSLNFLSFGGIWYKYE